MLICGHKKKKRTWQRSKAYVQVTENCKYSKSGENVLLILSFWIFLIPDRKHETVVFLADGICSAQGSCFQLFNISADSLAVTLNDDDQKRWRFLFFVVAVVNFFISCLFVYIYIFYCNDIFLLKPLHQALVHFL